MKLNKISTLAFMALMSMPLLTACSDSNNENDVPDLGPLNPSENTFGKAVGNFSAEEWYPGGLLGTTEDVSYSSPAPAVENIAISSNTFTHLNKNPERDLVLLGYVVVVSLVTLLTDMERDKRNIVQTPLAMVICSLFTIPTTTVTSLK